MILTFFFLHNILKFDEEKDASCAEKWENFSLKYFDGKMKSFWDGKGKGEKNTE